MSLLLGFRSRRLNLSKNVYSLSIALLTVLLIGPLISGCGKQQSAEKHDRDLSYSTIPVEVAIVHRQGLSVTKQYSGTLEGEEQANVVPKISERITAINARVGESVMAGQVLIELDKERGDFAILPGTGSVHERQKPMNG